MPGRLRQRHVFFEVGLEDGKPLHGRLALLPREGSGCGLCFTGMSHRFNNFCFCTVGHSEHKSEPNALILVAKLWCN